MSTTVKNKTALDLRITEIFFSIQGESQTVGIPTVFIRLTGCPLRCQYCDTSYAFQGGKHLSIAHIMTQVAEYRTRYVLVTGGEPLAQPNTFLLLSQLCEANYFVSLETSGALDISQVDNKVSKVLDIKTPGSGEEARNHWPNMAWLTPRDQVKFVICNRNDYLWAKQVLFKYNLTEKSAVLFSPSHNQLPAKTLAEWILDDRLPVRFQIQLHKYLWGDSPGH